MSVLAALLLAPVLAQGERVLVDPDDALHRTLELRVAGEEVAVELAVERAGTLHVWATADGLDPRLALRRAGAPELADDDGGGGTTAYIEVPAAAGETFTAALALADGEGRVALHWVLSPETDATRAAAEEARAALEAAGERVRSGDADGARARLVDAVEALAATPGAATSEAAARAAWDLGHAAYRSGALAACERAWRLAGAQRARARPATHPRVLSARQNLAVVLRQRGALADARELFVAVLAARERLVAEDDPRLLADRRNLAVVTKDLGDLAGALELEREVLDASERLLPEDHPDLLAARQNLAATLRLLGRLEEARALEEAVLASRERTLPEDHPALLVARANLAATLRACGELGRARELNELVLEARARLLPEGHPDLLAARQNLAVTLRLAGEPERARELEEAVLAARERTLPEGHPDLLAARANLAATLRALGELERAAALDASVLEERERRLPEDHPDLLSARTSRALVLRAQGEHDRARALFEEVLAARARALPADHPDLVAARMNLALALLEDGDLLRARALLERAVEAYERIRPPEHPELLAARMNLALALRQAGDATAARALEEATLATLERALPADHADLRAARTNLAVALLETGAPERARELQERVLGELRGRLDAAHPDVLRERQNLGATLWRLGDAEGARACFEAVLAAREASLPADHPDLLSTRSNLATALLGLDEAEAARALLEDLAAAQERALPAWHPERLRVQANLALARLRLGEEEAARALAERFADGLLARLDALALRSPREARAIAGSVDAWLAQAAFLLDPDGAAPARTFALVESWREAACGAPPPAAPEDAEERELRAALDARRAALNDLVAGGAAPDVGAEEHAADVLRLARERDRLERRLREHLAARGRAFPRLDAARVSAALEEGAAVLAFRRLDRWTIDADGRPLRDGERFVAHVLRPGGAPAQVDLGDAAEIETLVHAWRAALGQPLPRGVALPGREDPDEAAAGAALRARVLDPPLAALGEGARRLYVCLDDVLHLVPLAALPLAAQPAGGERVGDRYVVVEQPSLGRLVAPHPAPTGAPALLALGGASFDAAPAAPATAARPVEAAERRGGVRTDFPPLLQTRFEVEAVGALFESAFERPPALLEGDAATKARLRALAPGRRYVHLATHGWFAPEVAPPDVRAEDGACAGTSALDTLRGLAPATLCGLALAGANRGPDALGRVPGILTAEELAGLDLSECELAVLSACETNVGVRRAGQGIRSLQAALHAAGARTAVTSLWKVDDAATRRLMELFYGYLWLERLPKAEALWKAQRALRADGHPPRDWAAWVLSGDPE